MMIRGDYCTKSMTAVLETSYQAYLEGKPQLKLEELAVETWKKSQSVFGLKGYEAMYPDMRKIYIMFCGKKGLIRKGFFEWVDDKHTMLMLTPEGITRAITIIAHKAAEIEIPRIYTQEGSARANKVQYVLDKIRELRSASTAM